jgi:2-dehydropantoate 2-reductase
MHDENDPLTNTGAPFRKICIFGAGALGGAIAARLSTASTASDITVTAVARGEQLTALRRNDLHLWIEGTPTPLVTPITATDDATELGPQDLVITTLKGHQLPAAAQAIASLLHARTRVVMILNGIPWWYFHSDKQSGHEDKHLAVLDPEGNLWHLIDPARVIGCVAYYGAEVVSPGNIRLTRVGHFVFGEPANTQTADLEHIAALFERAGWQTTVSSRIRDEIWQKLLGNAAFNPISALTRADLSEMIDSPAIAALVKRIMAEVRAVGESLGIQFSIGPEERMAQARTLGPIRSSMLQDLEHGKTLEIDPLLQAVSTLGQITDTPTSVLDIVLALVRQLDDSARRQRR